MKRRASVRDDPDGLRLYFEAMILGWIGLTIASVLVMVVPAIVASVIGSTADHVVAAATACALSFCAGGIAASSWWYGCALVALRRAKRGGQSTTQYARAITRAVPSSGTLPWQVAAGVAAAAIVVLS
jgi:hypothetical protein